MRGGRRAIDVLLAGGIIAYPTEGVFGLGCLPDDVGAVRRLLALKQRDAAKGLILIAADAAQLDGWIALPDGRELPPPDAGRPVTWIVAPGPRVHPLLRGVHDGSRRATDHPSGCAAPLQGRRVAADLDQRQPQRPPGGAQQDSASPPVWSSCRLHRARRLRPGVGPIGNSRPRDRQGDTSRMNQLDPVKDYLQQLQVRITAELEAIDGRARFVEDAWRRDGGGGGRSRVLTGGAVFEQAGVGFSHVFGETMPPAATRNRPDLAGKAFQAVGVSLVLHPDNPYVPTTHANFRFFTAGDKQPVWWFGGGYDLTPYYPFLDDVRHWHRTARAACAPFGDDLYDKYKDWCDRYFFLPHRNETRGVGGLFFDDVNDAGFDDSFAFLRSVGDSFLDAYKPIVAERRGHRFGARQKTFQHYRRGRYVEFNLLYDRGTLFGLQSGGRTESILMSLPPQVRWEYGWEPEPGSPEAVLYDDYLRPRDWLGESGD